MLPGVLVILIAVLWPVDNTSLPKFGYAQQASLEVCQANAAALKAAAAKDQTIRFADFRCEVFPRGEKS